MLWNQFIRHDQVIGHCLLQDNLNQQTMEEETGKKTEICIARLEHQQMLWDPSDHSCKNGNKRKDALLWQIVEDLGINSPLFHIKNQSDRRQLCQVAFHQAGEATLRMVF